jgi:uncharacterized protein YjbI with pentapeptide repeats
MEEIMSGIERRVVICRRVLDIGPGANLAGHDLSGAQLAGIDLSGANLKGARLGSADLTGANLSDADLSGAILVFAQMRDAVVTGANFSWAKLRAAFANRLSSCVTATALPAASSFRQTGSS